MGRRGRKPSYKRSALIAAVRACLEKGLGVREAARRWGIPPATLSRQLIRWRKEVVKMAIEEAIADLEQRLNTLEERLRELEGPPAPAREREIPEFPSRDEVEGLIASLGNQVHEELRSIASRVEELEKAKAPSQAQAQAQEDLVKRLAKLEREFLRFKHALMRLHGPEGLQRTRAGLVHTGAYSPAQVAKVEEELRELVGPAREG